MTDVAVEETTQKRSLVVSMAHRYGIEKDSFLATIKATVFPSGTSVTNEQAAAFLVVAHEHDLNPFTREIYAFSSKSGGVVPVVGIDGWVKKSNSHPQFDGAELVDNESKDGEIKSVTCKMYRKDRKHPTVITESLVECRRNTDPWKKWPRRMLRHKAYAQAARYCFGFAGIYEEDEAQRILESKEVEYEEVNINAEEDLKKFDETTGGSGGDDQERPAEQAQKEPAPAAEKPQQEEAPKQEPQPSGSTGLQQEPLY